MTENLRESFRIEPSQDLETELFHEGRVVPCVLENLSAGGARLTTSIAMAVGAQCTLGVRLEGELRTAAARPYLSFLMEVLESETREDESIDVRLRNTTAPGSPEHEAATKLVFEAHRRWLARRSGADTSSPMVSDPERRRDLAPPQRARFSKRSMRPGQPD